MIVSTIRRRKMINAVMSQETNKKIEGEKLIKAFESIYQRKG